MSKRTLTHQTRNHTARHTVRRSARKPAFVLAMLGALALGAAACGPKDDADAFTGIWQIGLGSMTVACGGEVATYANEGFVTFQKAGETNLVRQEMGVDCSFRFRLGDQDPELVPGQSCIDSGFDEYGEYYSTELRPVAWMLKESGDESLTEQYTLTVTYLYGDQIDVCTVTAVSTLWKLGE